MRFKSLGLALACATALSVAAPAFACPFGTQASSDTQAQQTAQAQPTDQATRTQ